MMTDEAERDSGDEMKHIRGWWTRSPSRCNANSNAIRTAGRTNATPSE
jgi:hypothetical protein